MSKRFTRQIYFTAAEVNERLIFEGTPPVARLLPKHHPPVPNKVAYTQLLCERLSAATPNKSVFKVVAAFISNCGTTRCYVICEHKVKMPVWYKKASLRENHKLDFWLKIKCADCLEGPEEPTPIDVTDQITFAIPKINAPNEITEIFNQAVMELGGVLNRAYHRCSATLDPVRTLRERYHEIGEELVLAWRILNGRFFPTEVKEEADPFESSVEKQW
jgi:hypothetical protein